VSGAAAPSGDRRSAALPRCFPMRVVSDRDLGDDPVLDRFDHVPTLRGPGRQRLWCGHCGDLVLEGVDPGRLHGVIFRCHCGAYNRPVPSLR